MVLGGVALLSLMGSGCSLKSFNDINEADVEDDGVSQVKKENAELKKDLAMLEKKLDSLEKEASEKKDAMEKEDEEEKDEAWFENATEEELAELEKEQSKKEYPTNERGREIISPVSLVGDLGERRVDIMLVSHSDPDPKQSESPAFRFGCEDYLYPYSINLEEDKTQSDLATALVQLLTFKPGEDLGMTNEVRAKGFALENVTYEDGVRIIELSAKDVNSRGTCEGPRIKAQFEETIAMYSENFEIRLNGTADAWRCLYDESGACSS